jgi:hypothetical protein
MLFTPDDSGVWGSPTGLPQAAAEQLHGQAESLSPSPGNSCQDPIRVIIYTVLFDKHCKQRSKLDITSIPQFVIAGDECTETPMHTCTH